MPKSAGSSKKQESSRKPSTSALLTLSKPLTMWITTNCVKFFLWVAGASGAEWVSPQPSSPPRLSQLHLAFQVQKLWAAPHLASSLLFLAFPWTLLCSIWINCKSPLITRCVETDILLPRVWWLSPGGVPICKAASYGALSLTHTPRAANSLSKKLLFRFLIFQ